MTGPTVVIFDDDPTGTQAVAGIPVVTSNDPHDIAWAFETSPRGFFVLTNTRSLDESAMVGLTQEAVHAVLYVAAGRPVRFVSRSDSTLRGHVYAEPEAIRTAVHDFGLPAPRVILFAPAFPAAGRVTRCGVHLLRDEAGIERPAHESTYAKDATFGYMSSELARVVAARSSGAIEPSMITVAAVGDPSRLDRALDRGGWVVADASTDEDLAHIARTLRRIDPTGRDVIVRCSPGLLPALFCLPAAAQVPGAGEPVGHGGLVIVGSHVARTTRQLERLLSLGSVVPLSLDVDALVDADPLAIDHIVVEMAQAAVARLPEKHVVVSTSRAVRQWKDPTQSLEFARRVSDVLVRITRSVVSQRTLRFVVAKGGITSSDIATRGLGIRRAVSRGMVGAGIVWEPIGGESPRIALVPGNIGDDEGLAEAVREMSRQRSEE